MYRRLIPAVCLFVLCMGLAGQATEIVPFSAPSNVALNGTATSSSTCYGWLPEMAIDDNIGTGSHSCTTAPDEWWEVELDQDYDLGEIVVWNRASCCWERMAGVVVKVLDAGRNETYVSEPIVADTSAQYQGSVHSFDNDGAGFPGARYIRVEAGVSYVQLMEVQAFLVYPFARNPNPADGATDVTRDDTVLSWTPGASADKHDVYFGTSFDDVNDADTASSVYMGSQDATTYATAQLDLGQTYYWRVDEVDADLTIYKGDIVQFTVEPVAYPIENVTATASGNNSEAEGPENTINSAGLDANDLHSIEPAGMWLSSDDPNGAWIQYEFDTVYKLHQMQVWNHNTLVEAVLGFGVKDATIEYSVDGNDYTTLGTTHEFARAPGAAGYAANTIVDLSGVAAKYVKITANSNWGGIVKQYGLSEVRFSYVPVWSREPDPASGTTGMDVDNVTLSWRAGREAALHDVYISTDELEVIDETISPVNVPGGTAYASYDTGELELGATYYWKVNEVNGADTWQGEVSNFSTKVYFVVETFEAYNDILPDRIFETWIDGFGFSGQPGNGTGSMAGYLRPPYAEQSIIHGGSQSMPLFYDNSGAAGYSETTVNVANLAIDDVPVDRNWAKPGIKTLSLWFYGDTSNSAEQMYVKLNGSKVLYNGNAESITRAGWQPWNIELADFGVDLSNVTELSIGFERSGDIGGSGMVYFDDFRLYAKDRQPTWETGQLGSALVLDGTTYVEVPARVFASIEKQITVAFWLYNDSTPPNNTVFGAFIDATDNNARIASAHVPWGGTIYWDTSSSLGAWAPDRINKAIPYAEYLGAWHHYAFVKNAETGMQEIYIDGVVWHSMPEMTQLVKGAEVTAFTIGCFPRLENFYVGLLDDFRLYDRALSEGELAWLGGITEPFDTITPAEPDTANLVGHWTFDEGSGTTAADSVGDNDGTINKVF